MLVLDTLLMKFLAVCLYSMWKWCCLWGNTGVITEVAERLLDLANLCTMMQIM